MRDWKRRSLALSLQPALGAADGESIRRAKGDWALRPEREEELLRWPTTGPPAAETATERVTR